MLKRQRLALLLLATVPFAAFSMLLTAVGFSDSHTLAMTGMWTVYITFAVVWMIYCMPATRLEKLITVVAYACRVMVVFVETATGGYIRNVIMKSGDANGFHEWALMLYQGDKDGFRRPYITFLSWQYRLVGVNNTVAALFTVLAFMLSVYVVYVLLGHMGIRSRYQWVALLVFCFLPYNFVYSSETMKEAYIILLHMLVLYGLVMWMEHKNIYIMLSYASGFTAMVFHSGAVCSLVVLTLFMMLYDRERQRFHISRKLIIVGIAAMVMLVISVSIVPVSKVLWKWVPRTDSLLESVITSYYLHYNENGGSRYLEGMELNGMWDLVRYTPVRMFYFMFSPMPWNFRNIFDAVIFCADGLVHAFVLVMMVNYLVRYGRDAKKNIILYGVLIMLACSAAFAWGVATAGTAVRHRGTISAIELVCMCVCLDEGKRIRRRK